MKAKATVLQIYMLLKNELVVHSTPHRFPFIQSPLQKKSYVHGIRKQGQTVTTLPPRSVHCTEVRSDDITKNTKNFIIIIILRSVDAKLRVRKQALIAKLL